MQYEALFIDLKQFIAATISQQMSGYLTKNDFERILDEKLDKKLDEKLDEKLDKKFDEKFSSFERRFEQKIEAKFDRKLDEIRADIADALTQTNEIYGAWFNDHERRLQRLERRLI